MSEKSKNERNGHKGLFFHADGGYITNGVNDPKVEHRHAFISREAAEKKKPEGDSLKLWDVPIPDYIPHGMRLPEMGEEMSTWAGAEDAAALQVARLFGWKASRIKKGQGIAKVDREEIRQELAKELGLLDHYLAVKAQKEGKAEEAKEATPHLNGTAPVEEAKEASQEEAKDEAQEEVAQDAPLDPPAEEEAKGEAPRQETRKERKARERREREARTVRTVTEEEEAGTV